jgi:hypothetical protein
MLKREIKYEDFDGKEVTETFYFNISKPELIELEVEFEQGFGKMLENIIETKDHKELIKKFKEIVLLAYGVKSEDGKRFVKSDQLREEFSQSAAYNTLFMELATDDNAAVVFLKNVLPKDMVGQIDETTLASLPTPPTSPSPPIPPNI